VCYKKPQLMRQILLLIFTFFSYTFSYAQAGAGPIQSCSAAIPEICNGALYPAATSGAATAPGANFICQTYDIDPNASFYYFESATNGPLNIDLTPVDILGNPDPAIDLDFICWGPFNDLNTMCSQLTQPNALDCSYLSNTVIVTENIQIANSVAGEFYVVMVANWAQTGTNPAPCFMQFTSAGANDAFGGAAPGDAGGTVGVPNPILFCDSDPMINLIDELNGTPLNSGSWTYNGNTITGTFDPASDPSGIYTYFIPGTVNCPSDEAYVGVDVFTASSISVTSPAIICSNENSFTLTGIPPAGWSAQGQGVFTDTTGISITDFDPAIYGAGNHNITYTYTITGCAPIAIGSSILVNQAPTVLPNNIIITNPSCFGYTDGTVIISASGGSIPYNYNWYGQDPLQLPSGTFNYTVTDDNLCSYSSSVTLFDPLNTSSIINGFNSSCFGANDGAATITMIGGATPPGTVSDPDPDNNGIPYCPSNPNPTWAAQPQTIIEAVQFTGNNFEINNNTSGSNDFYEDYTNNTGLNGEYADITEGQAYTINITLGNMSTSAYDPEAVNIYIDFNIDGDFLDAGEDLGVINIPWGTFVPGSVYPFNIIVPSTGAFGATRMRVVSMGNSGAGVTMSACESPVNFDQPWFGSTEDYSIVLSAPGASATFLWDNGSTADSISNLGPGTYYIIITISGCPFQDLAIVTEPSEIIFNPTITDISCNSFTDGSITLSPSGGNGGGYIIDWGSTNPLALGDSSYIVTVSDPNTITATNLDACENDTTIVMIEPNYFSVDFSTSTDLICLNDSVTLDFNFNQGGVPPYTVNYTVNNGPLQVVGPINNILVFNNSVYPSTGNNTYIIDSIIDANGCINQNNINAQNIYVNPLPDVNISVAPNPICDGDTAILFFNTLNGQPPLQVFYNANGTPLSQVVLGGGDQELIFPNVTTTYQLESVADANGCENYPISNTTLNVNVIPEMNWSVPSEVCDNDIVYLSFEFLTGTPPWNVTYNINGTDYNLPATYNVLDSVSILPLNGSVYSVISLTDGNQCKDLLNENLTITSSPLPEIVLSGGGSICNDGSETDIIFTITSGVPPYDLNFSAGVTSFSRSNIGNIYSHATNLGGIYTIQELTDNKGCKAISISGSAYVSINPLPEANITAYPQPANIINPQISFIDLSTDHVNGMWDFDNGDTTLTNFNRLVHTYADTGTYQVSLTIESDSGCTDIAWQTIIISPVFTIYVPNAFTPNNDLNNDYFLPIIDGASEYEFSVYDRTGQEVFITNDFSNNYLSCITDNTCSAAWNGKINNGTDYATKGTYVYKIILTDFNGKARTYEGAVTLIR
jgi:hypothetical protein